MFRTLGPRLAAARHVERELDRVLASRFNPLDYLRTDELGLSRILADLLNPNAAHGQGAAFLLSTHRSNYNNVLWTAERSFGYGCPESVPGNKLPTRKHKS